MKIFINDDSVDKKLSETIKKMLIKNNYQIIESQANNFFDRVVEGMKLLQNKTVNEAILIDEIGNKSFMIASKFQDVVAASISDEHSAYMTKLHNNSNVLVLGSDIVGINYGTSIAKYFIKGTFEAGRHMVRIDMLHEELK